MSAPFPRLARAGRIVLGLMVGVGGGYLFLRTGLPLPWLLGAMIATMVAVLMRAPVLGEPRMRTVVRVTIGVMLGGGFSPETVAHMRDWSVTIVALLAFVALSTAILFVAAGRWSRMDRVTAFFALSPGGFGEMLLTGISFGGDGRAISLAHSVRILMTVALIALWFQWFQGYEPAAASSGALRALSALSPRDALVLIGCGVAGYLGGRVLRIPAGALLGPLAVSAVVHAVGFSAAQMPQILVSACQVVVGIAAGERFKGATARDLAGAVGAGIASTTFLLGGATASAFGLAALTGVGFPALLLAFAPGGLAEMCLISLALGIDTAFVSTHHSARLIFLVLCLPFVARGLFGRRAPGDGGA